MNFRGHPRIVGLQCGTCHMLLSGSKNLEVAPRFLEYLCILGIVVLFTSDIIKYVVPGDDILEHCMMLKLGDA